MKLSEKLKKAREQIGYSQQDVADKLNISRQSISRWENGWTYPDIENLIVLSNLYNVSLDELLKEDEQNNRGDELSEEEPDKEEKKVHPYIDRSFVEIVGISITAMLTCGIPILGLIVNIILIGYCIHKKLKVNLIYKIILIIFFVLSVYNTYVYLDFMFIHTGKATIEKVAFLYFGNI